MNADFMGAGLDATDFYLETPTGAGTPGAIPPAGYIPPRSSGLTTQGASVLTGLFDTLGTLGSTLITTFGGQPAAGTPAAVAVTPGAIPPAGYIPPRSSMDPVVLAAIGIPVALVAVAMMRGGRR
jgi:hypothetical protein